MARKNSPYKGVNMGSTAIALALSVVTMSAGNPVHPAQASISPVELDGLRRDYRIPAGAMDVALNSFADRSGLHVVFDVRLTERIRTAGVDGVYSVEEGLDRLLSGTGLTYRLAENGRSVSIILAQAATGTQSDASGATPLPLIDVGGERSEAAPRRGPAPQGPGDRYSGYRATSATSALKMDTPILKTPVAVQVVTRQSMDDQQAISVTDSILSNVSGVQQAASYFDMFKVRGFVASAYRNGLLQLQNNNFDTANLQAVEVVKGPASVLFGRVEPGGLVNLVVKRPLETPYYSIQEQVGSYGLTRTTVDLTGPVTQDKSVLYRFNGAFYRKDSFRDYVNDKQLFLAPTITWRPTEQFRVNVDFEYQRWDYVDDYPMFPAVGQWPASIPVSRYLQQPTAMTNPANAYDRKFIAYDWRYDFAPDWSLSNRLSYTSAAVRTADTSAIGFDPIGGGITGMVFDFPGYTGRTFATNADLKGKFATGPIEHSILVGYDYFNYFQPPQTVFISFQPTINIYAPVYAAAPFTNLYANSPFYVTNGQKWSGIYGQDLISFFDDRVHLLIGGRYDWAQFGQSTKYDSPAIANASYSSDHAKKFSPRLALLVQPFPWLSLYGNYTQSLGANNRSSMTNTVLPPEKGEQFEAGVKATLLDDRLTATMAYFDVTKTNIATPDPLNPFNTILIGKARSEGFEFDLTGRIDDNWSVIANYTHDDVRVVNGSANDPTTEYFTQLAVPGNKMPGSPRNYGNLWVKYEADGALRGLSLGGGVTIAESAFGDNANSFLLPSYALVNGMISYRADIAGYTVTTQLNIKNLNDARYFSTSWNRTTIMPGAPRTFLGSVRVEF